MISLTALVTIFAVSRATAQTIGDCKDGVYIVVARGSNEPPGEGALSKLADRVIDRIPGSDSIGIDYPATFTDPLYFDSVPEGVGNMTQLVTKYSDKCPSTKLVLMGYSQGAQVVGDVLIGSNSSGFKPNTPLDSKYIDRVLAAILLGDPTFVLNVSINVGNATKGGLFPRGNTDQWAARNLSSRVKNYCDFNDTFCDNGDSLAVHVGYIPEYGSQALDFITNLYNNGSTNSTSAGSSSSSTTSATTSGRPTSTSSTTSSPSGSASSGASPSASPTPGSNSAVNGFQSSSAGYFALASFFAAAFAFIL